MNGRPGAFDFPLKFVLNEVCNNAGRFDMSQLDHAGLAGISPLNAVTFVENHDTDLNPVESMVFNKVLGYAYILTSDGYPCVLGGYAQLGFPSSADLKDKKALFHAGKAALAGARPDLIASIESLERASALTADDLLEDIDVDILAFLQNAYLRNGDAEKAEDTERRLDHKRSLIESRDFLELAKHFKADGRDYIWALEIAAHVKIENEFSRHAQERLMQFQDF